MKALGNPAEQCRQRLPTPYAHGDDAQFQIPPDQVLGYAQAQHGTGGTHRVAQRNGPAIGIGCGRIQGRR